jgi:hypothetical protein
MTTRALALVFVLALAACGGEDDGGGPAAIADSLALTIDSSSVSIVAGASQSLTLHLARSGSFASAAVQLLTSGVPADIDVSFDQALTSSDTAALTIAVDPLAAAQTATFTVIGEVNGQAATAGVALTIVAASTITVKGKVVGIDGAPLARAGVSVWSHGSTEPIFAPVSADGTFNVPGVVAPYDLAAVSDLTFIALGLTRADPVLIGSNSEGPVNPHITVGGAIGAANDTYVTLDCADIHGETKLAGGGSTYSVALRGPAAVPLSCKLRALGVSGASTLTPTYTGYVERDVTLSNAATANVDLTPAAVAAHTVTVNLSGVPTDGAVRANLTWRVAGAQPVTLTTPPDFDVAGLTSLTVSVPTDPRVVVVLQLETVSAEPSGSLATVALPSSADTIDVALPTPGSVLTPANGASGIDLATAVFATTDVPGAAHLFVFGPSSGTGGRFVLTKSARVTANDLLIHGAPLSHGEQYTWDSEAYLGIGSVDALVDPATTGILASNGGALSIEVVAGRVTVAQ